MNAAIQVLAAVVTIAVVGIITYFKWIYAHWKRKGVPYLVPIIPFGTSENPFCRKDHIGVRFAKQYNELKLKGHKHGGLFNFVSPVYLPIDPEYVKNIMSKDFSHFMDRGVYSNERTEPLRVNLFHMEGQKWKNLRSKLTPAFTSGKIKAMFQTVLASGEQLKLAVEELYQKNDAVDVRNIMECFTTDVIASCMFGLDCNSFKDADSEFCKYGRTIFSSGTINTLKIAIAFENRSLARFLGITIMNPEAADFFMKVVKDTVSYREKMNFVRNDFMQILIDLKNSARDKEKDDNENPLTVEEVAAQAFLFYIAGFETSSITMTFCLYELSRNEKIQDIVRKEVGQVLERHNGDLTYEAVMEMKYLDQVVDETLRKYPPAPDIPRICVEDYKIPDTEIILEKGTAVIIPVLALHRDPEFFPEPDKFDPERFSDVNKHLIRPFTYIPFGAGPRICIGLRFGLLQTKVGLATLIRNFKFSVNKNTKVPLSLSPFSFGLTAKELIWLDIKKISC